VLFYIKYFTLVMNCCKFECLYTKRHCGISTCQNAGRHLMTRWADRTASHRFSSGFFSKRFKLFCRQNIRRQRVTNRIKSFRHHSHSSRHKPGRLTWGQCYKTNAAVNYCHFRLNNHRNIYNIDFTLE
jgi:hypothetical protein